MGKVERENGWKKERVRKKERQKERHKRKRQEKVTQRNNKVNATDERSLTHTHALLRNERDIHPPLGERKRVKERERVCACVRVCACACVCFSGRGGYDYSADLAPTLSYGWFPPFSNLFPIILSRTSSKQVGNYGRTGKALKEIKKSSLLKSAEM